MFHQTTLKSGSHQTKQPRRPLARHSQRLLQASLTMLLCLMAASVQAAPLLAPTNDNLANAIQVTSLPFVDTVVEADADTAAAEAGELDCLGATKSWWYELTPDTSGNIAITAGGDGGGLLCNTRLGLYTGTTHPLTQVSCTNDNDFDTLGEQETLALTAGTTYYIRVATLDPGSTNPGAVCQTTITGDVLAPLGVGGVAEFIELEEAATVTVSAPGQNLGYGLLAVLGVLAVAIVGVWQLRRH